MERNVRCEPLSVGFRARVHAKVREAAQRAAEKPVEAPVSAFRHWVTTEGGYRIGHLGDPATCTNPICTPKEG